MENNVSLSLFWRILLALKKYNDKEYYLYTKYNKKNLFFKEKKSLMMAIIMTFFYLTTNFIL